jgi:PadR family transcriptional regulator, regulatory protein PadR
VRRAVPSALHDAPVADGVGLTPCNQANVSYSIDSTSTGVDRPASNVPYALILTIKMSGSTFKGHVMASPSTDLVQGTLDLLILKSLSLEPMHGFGIARRIQAVSQGVFRVNPGSLLVAFQRLERAGLIKGDWKLTENNRRARFYRLTEHGRRKLTAETQEWERRSAAIARLLNAT